MRHIGSTAATSLKASTRKILQADRVSSIGRVGKLSLEYIRQGDRTVFGKTNCQTPWHLLPPIYLDDTGSAYTLLVNPSGGLVGGDHLSIDLSVGPKAHALISSPSANRVYRSLSEDAVLQVTITVGPNGILEWVPEHTIPFAGSSFRQSIDVSLSDNATVVLWDAVASGRIAHGERWKFARLDNQICITMASGTSVKEHYVLTPSEMPGGIGLAEEWDYVGSLFVIGDAIDITIWASLDNTLAGILDMQSDQLLGGVSRPTVPGLVVKLVAKSAPALTIALNALWGAIRQAVWKLPPAILRKY
jgi:urease accessory protein